MCVCVLRGLKGDGERIGKRSYKWRSKEMLTEGELLGCKIRGSMDRMRWMKTK